MPPLRPKLQVRRRTPLSSNSHRRIQVSTSPWATSAPMAGSWFSFQTATWQVSQAIKTMPTAIAKSFCTITLSAVFSRSRIPKTFRSTRNAKSDANSESNTKPNADANPRPESHTNTESHTDARSDAGRSDSGEDRDRKSFAYDLTRAGFVGWCPDVHDRFQFECAQPGKLRWHGRQSSHRTAIPRSGSIASRCLMLT